jgi:malonyl-CoA/methylmalonyl-CoA synthetase
LHALVLDELLQSVDDEEIVVVVRDGETIDERAMIRSLKDEIAPFKVPKRVHVVDELPRNAMGKVQKNVLRERFS